MTTVFYYGSITGSHDTFICFNHPYYLGLLHCHWGMIATASVKLPLFVFFQACKYWNVNIILTKFSSLAALEVVIDNFQCSQWWKFRQNDDISISVDAALHCKVYKLVTHNIYFTSVFNHMQQHGCLAAPLHTIFTPHFYRNRSPLGHPTVPYW